MRFCLQGMDFDIRKVVRKQYFFHTHQVDGVVLNKEENDWTKEEREKMKQSLKSKTIITMALSIGGCLYVSLYKSVKNMCNTLQVTHEGIIDIKRARMNTISHEYKLFMMKLEENIYDLQKKTF